MDNQLKKLDSSYIMTFSGIYNNKLIMFLTARITEYSKEEQNKVAMKKLLTSANNCFIIIVQI